MFDTRLTLYKGKDKLIVIDHRGRTAAEIEIDVCNKRIRRGEATHLELESLSSYGAGYIRELRERVDVYEP